MLSFSQEVSHLWERENTLRQWRAGQLSTEDICDADFLLRAAAHHHGEDRPGACPVCGHEALRLTHWVYGDALGRKAGSARSVDEIAELAADVGAFTVHWVEVCQRCGWNHLLRGAQVEDKPSQVG